MSIRRKVGTCVPGVALSRYTGTVPSITQTSLNVSPLGTSSIFKRAFGGRKRPEVTVFPVTDRKPKKPTTEAGGVSLKEVFPGTPPQGSFEATKATTYTTTLDNGIVVSTEETYDQASTVGIFINAGSANETLETNGTTHLLQRMGFKATKDRTNQQIVRQLETLGVNAVSSSSRECVVYSTDCMRGYTPDVVEILADTIQNPLFLEEDVQREKSVMNHELTDLHLDPSTWLTEVVHELAFGQEGFGLSQICPFPNLENIGRDQIVKFRDTYFTGPNIVVAACGVEHESFVKLISEQFKHCPSVRSPNEIRVNPSYKGGYHVEVMLPEDEKKMKEILPQTGKEAPSHLVLAFGTEGLMTDDLYPTCVLQTLMGGGSSFSSGGPGKGMYSRLYREVLNSYGWVDSISCFNSFYKNAGVFGFYGTVPHGSIGEMLQIMAQHAIDMAVGFSDEEVERAKNQLSASIFMNLESRTVLYDDIGRQILAYGHRKPANEVCEQIAKVTEEDLVRVANKIMHTKPSIAAYTPQKYVSRIPQYDVVVDWFPNVLKEAAKHRSILQNQTPTQN